MTNFLYGLSVCGASSSDLITTYSTFKMGAINAGIYIWRKLNIRKLLERSDCRIFRKVRRTNSPLVKILPERNFTNYALRKPCVYHLIVATER